MPDLVELLDAADAETPTPDAPAEGAAEATTPAETLAEGEQNPDPDAPPSPEAPATAAPSAPDPLSDEALAALDSPESVRAAVDALKAERSTFRKERDQKFLSLRRWERQQKQREARFKAVLDERTAQFKAEDDTLKDIFDNGNSDKLLSYLAHRTGRDPLRVLEAINLAALGKKAAPEPNAEVKALQARLDAKEAAERENAQKQQAEQTDAWVAQRVSAMVELAKTKPHARLLTERSPKAVGKQLVEIKKEAYEATGAPISDQEAVDVLEQNLAALALIAAGHGQAPTKPETKPKTTTLTSRQVASSGAPLSLTQLSDEEHTRALANDDEFMGALFG